MKEQEIKLNAKYFFAHSLVIGNKNGKYENCLVFEMHFRLSNLKQNCREDYYQENLQLLQAESMVRQVGQPELRFIEIDTITLKHFCFM